MHDRTTLYRVMDVALKQFLVYREMSWHAFEIESLQKLGGKEGEGQGGEGVIIHGEVRCVHIRQQCLLCDEAWENIEGKS